jgi:hypothetical protein
VAWCGVSVCGRVVRGVWCVVVVQRASVLLVGVVVVAVVVVVVVWCRGSLWCGVVG